MMSNMPYMRRGSMLKLPPSKSIPAHTDPILVVSASQQQSGLQNQARRAFPELPEELDCRRLFPVHPIIKNFSCRQQHCDGPVSALYKPSDIFRGSPRNSDYSA